VAAEEWQRKTQRVGNLAEFFASSAFARLWSQAAAPQRPSAQSAAVSFLLDTNTVSEWVKPRPNPGLIRWMESADEDTVFVSVVTFAELRYGIERLAAGKRRKRLEDWLSHEVQLRFEGRILAVDARVADLWGRTVARCEAIGRPISSMGAFLSAIAEVHALTLVTRNVSDFSLLKSVVNPWAP
jgi:toxin FitB